MPNEEHNKLATLHNKLRECEELAGELAGGHYTFLSTASELVYASRVFTEKGINNLKDEALWASDIPLKEE